MERAVTETLSQCRQILAGHYGPRFKGLVLYGSMAGRRAIPASDIDVLVLLGEPFDYSRDLRQIVDLLYPVQLETSRLISAKPASVVDYAQGRVQLYRNAKREGVVL